MPHEGSSRAVAMTSAQTRDALAAEWRRLSRAATVVALLTSPALLALLIGVNGWPVIWALVVTVIAVAAFRGFVDIVANRFIPRPSLYGADREALADDATARRRLWFWRGKFRLLRWLAAVFFGVFGLVALITGQSIGGVLSGLGDWISESLPVFLILAIQLPMLFLAN